MFIKKKDLLFLIELENKLGKADGWSDDVIKLWELNERLLKQRERDNEKARLFVAERRKDDPNYARSKKKEEHKIENLS